MPPSAAPEWLRVGWSFEMTPTFAPASYAAIAARMPAQPAPTTRTSCVASIGGEAIGKSGGPASAPRARRPHRVARVGEALEVLREHRRELLRLRVVGCRITPRGARIEQR